MYQYEKLDVWKQSLVVVKSVYGVVKEFPKEEQFSLSNQIKRAAVSISLNIAEGRASDSQKEFVKYLNISLKSLYEVSAGFKISIELDYLNASNDEYSEILIQMDRLGAGLRSLINKIKRDNAKSK